MKSKMSLFNINIVMEQSQLATRVRNKLQLILRGMEEREVDTFNDLLVIHRIVPKLPSETLKTMIRLLRPFND